MGSPPQILGKLRFGSSSSSGAGVTDGDFVEASLSEFAEVRHRRYDTRLSHSFALAAAVARNPDADADQNREQSKETDSRPGSKSQSRKKKNQLKKDKASKKD